MQIEILTNEGVTFLLSPETPLEEELIKALMKQDNGITEFRSPVTVINKTFRSGVVIGKKSSPILIKEAGNLIMKDDKI